MSTAYVEDRFEIEAPVLALTYDDGPSEWTHGVLDHLVEHDCTATFFVIGELITKERAETLRRIVRCGCELGIHGYTHRPLPSLSGAEIRDEFARTNELIQRATGVEVRYWRPPHLLVDDAVRDAVSSLDLLEVSGSLMAKDWVAGATAVQIAGRVTAAEEFRRGAIVVLHDGRSPLDGDESAPTREATVEATGLIVAAMRERGLRSVTVSELVAAK